MAGESAREVARQKRDKADRMQRSAELWERGAVGEEATAQALAALPADEWTVLHDVRWPGRRYANVDYVVIGPPGVFVIDSKHWSGRITVRDGVLRQNGRSRESAVAGAAEAAMAVAQLAPSVPSDRFHAALCFVADQELSGWARDVMVCSTGNVVAMLRTWPSVMTAAERGLAALELDASLRAAVEAPAPAAGVRPRVPAQRKPVKAPPRRTAKGARARRRRRTDAIKAVVALAAASVLLFVPGAVEAVAGLLAGFFAS